MRFGDFHSPQYNIKWSDFDPTAISPDYATLLELSDEFYRVHCPTVDYYELDKINSTKNSAGAVPGRQTPSNATVLSSLWGEHVGAMQFSRKLGVCGFPSYSEGRRHMLNARGLEIEQLVRFSCGLTELQRKDIFPSIGDQINYLGLRFTVLEVYVRPEDIYMQTGLPLHITVDSAIYRFGDSKREFIRQDLVK